MHIGKNWINSMYYTCKYDNNIWRWVRREIMPKKLKKCNNISSLNINDNNYKMLAFSCQPDRRPILIMNIEFELV